MQKHPMPLAPGAALTLVPLALLAAVSTSTAAAAVPAALSIHPMLFEAKLATFAGLGGLLLFTALMARRFTRLAGFAEEVRRLLLTVALGVAICFASLVALGSSALDGRGMDAAAFSAFALPTIVCTGFGLVVARFLLARRAEAPLAPAA